MEEKMMMMMINSPENPRDENTSKEPINTSTCPSWKLYENPFYNSSNHHQQQNQNQNLEHQQQCQSSSKSLQCLHLPISARKLAASFWDLTFFKPVMESEIELARSQIVELKTELEYERKVRKKLESINKKLGKELGEERRSREAIERMCQELAKEISFDKGEINRMKKEMEEERKMMRMSEVLREERVQMKLAEAKIFLEEKLLELEDSKRVDQSDDQYPLFKVKEKRGDQEVNPRGTSTAGSKNLVSFSGKFRNFVLGEKISASSDNSRVDSMESARSGFVEKSICSDYSNDLAISEGSTRSLLSQKISGCNDDSNTNNARVSSVSIRRRASSETENPHIKRGIKGFVEFPRVVRAIGSKNRQWGTKLECQKAQLRILLKTKSPIRSNNLII